MTGKRHLNTSQDTGNGEPQPSRRVTGKTVWQIQGNKIVIYKGIYKHLIERPTVRFLPVKFLLTAENTLHDFSELDY